MNGDETQERPTNLADLMAELIPPPEPDPVSLVPQTIGWPILAIFLASMIVLLVVRTRRRQRAEAYRKAALAALESANSDPEAVARILRQTALTAFPRTDVASLYGADWLSFLDATCDDAGFQNGAGQPLTEAPYRTISTLPEDTVALVRHWIAHHSRTAAL